MAQDDMKTFEAFRAALRTNDVLTFLREGLIGEGVDIEGPFGPRKLVYADYVASGRPLLQVERFVLDHVLPFYANSHTEASFCGGAMTRLRRAARKIVLEACGAGEEHAAIFCGSGATAGLNRLVHLSGVADSVRAGLKATVVIGPYEHHSNILPWRESGAEVIEIAEDPFGGPDLAQLDAVLRKHAASDVLVCSFSAASNVTGIVADVPTITRKAKTAGAFMVWDYAGAGPYLPIDMMPSADCPIDAIVLSPHKFVGGPSASGVLVVRRQSVDARRPTWPGGGTVRFVSPWGHDFSGSLEAREEAGTPNVVGDIRAALAFIVKDAIGPAFIEERSHVIAGRAVAYLRGIPNIELLGNLEARRLPFLSFRLRDGEGGYVHQQLVTRMLSDRFGIQARGGCACAGPYVHRLLDVDRAESERMRSAILAGDEIEKPGFTRLNLSVLSTDAKNDFILESVATLATDAASHVHLYEADMSRAIFVPKKAA